MNRQNTLTLVLLTLLVILGILYLMRGESQTTLDESGSDFAVADTSQITSIRLTDFRNNKPSGEEIRLERRDDGTWALNEQYTALPKKVDNLLKTIKLIRVKEAVSEEARTVIFRILKSRHIRVEIETRNGDDKVYFVGSPDHTQKGTYMLMDGAEDPYVTYIPGFNGYLTPRFLPFEDEWREKVVFEAGPALLSRISLQSGNPDSTWHLEKTQTGWRLDGTAPVDTAILYRYLQRLKGKVYAQEFAAQAVPHARDSLQQIPPDLTYFLGQQADTVAYLEIWRRPEDPGTYFVQPSGGRPLYIVQHYNLNPFLQPRRLWELPAM